MPGEGARHKGVKMMTEREYSGWILTLDGGAWHRVIPRSIALLWLLFGIILSWVTGLAGAEAAQAALCKTLGDHQICILSITRSAKNYWEYRAAVSVDGVKRPVEVYDCRARTRQSRQGGRVPFEPDGPGELICHLLKS